MAQVDVSTSARLDPLKVLFGPSWKDILSTILWELYEELDPNDVLYTVNLQVDRKLFGVLPIKFAIKHDIKVGDVGRLLEKLVGARLTRGA